MKRKEDLKVVTSRRSNGFSEKKIFTEYRELINDALKILNTYVGDKKY